MSQDHEFCPVHYALQVIGGKWKLLIVWNLISGGKRFNELQRAIGDISTKVLSDQLKQLESDGVLTRHATETRPPQVTYSLTPFGYGLEPVMQAMYAWAKKTEL